MGEDESPDQPDAPASVAKVIAEAWHGNFALNLDREEAAFLAGIHAYLLEAREPSLDDETLRRIFVPVYELSQSGTDTETQRATLMIGRLRGQGILFLESPWPAVNLPRKLRDDPVLAWLIEHPRWFEREAVVLLPGFI